MLKLYHNANSKTSNIHSATTREGPTVDQTKGIIPLSFETQCKISLDETGTCHESVVKGIPTQEGTQ